MPKKSPLGSGGRFAQLKEKLAAKPAVANPAALAASIGAKKYGAPKMQSMAAAGKKRGPRESASAKKLGNKPF